MEKSAEDPSEDPVEEVTETNDEEEKVDPALEKSLQDRMLSDPNFIEQMKKWQNDPKFKEVQKLLQPHKFWDTQPVPSFKDGKGTEGPLKEQTLEEVSKEPTKLPAGFEWSDINIQDEA